MHYLKFSKILIGLLILSATFSVSAQKSKSSKKKSAKKSAATQTTPVAVIETKTVNEPEIKKNARPETENQTISGDKNAETTKKNSRSAAPLQDKPVYFYEFAKPEFLVSKVSIEHDENGKGKITLQKKDFTDSETDPIQLSQATLERVKAAWNALNFLDSNENYQHVRDYSHLGTMKFSMKKDGRERTATFNWTDNSNAKILADEYRKIGYQFIWIFDMNVALENQPLDAPRLFVSLDSMLKRNEISDPVQMIPHLKQLSNDERIPLIARNHAAKIILNIEKQEKKKADK